jgi:hypothetical protein
VGHFSLFLRLRWFGRLIDDERLYAVEFLLKAGHEVVRSVLKKHDKAEGKKKE